MLVVVKQLLIRHLF